MLATNIDTWQWIAIGALLLLVLLIRFR